MRIIRACRELGIESVATYSDADADALHTRLADRSERIGPAPARRVVPFDRCGDRRRAPRPGQRRSTPAMDSCRRTRRLPARSRMRGSSSSGRRRHAGVAGRQAGRATFRAAAGVPIVPGLLVPLVADEDGSVSAVDLAEVGFPAMIKAAAGGGGRGMRQVADRAELEAALPAAGREAPAAFGDGTLYLERLISPARHVEVQLLGDRHGNLAVLGERDCSVQRRHQKLVEESPSPAVDPGLRAELAESARRVAGTVAFHNAATVEFLVDAEGSHYFLEMNTRLQVEHGVTELVTGLDLVGWQIRVAAGERLAEAVLASAPVGPRHRGAPLRRGSAPAISPRSRAPCPTWRDAGRPGSSGRRRRDRRHDAACRIRPAPGQADGACGGPAGSRRPAPKGPRRDSDRRASRRTSRFLRWLVDQPAFVTGAYDTGLIQNEWGGRPRIDR